MRYPLFGAVIMLGLFGAFALGKIAQRDHDHKAAIDAAIERVDSMIVVYDTVLRVDTVQLRRLITRADTVRETTYVVVGALDSAAKAGDSVSSTLVLQGVKACKDAIAADSAAIAAAQTTVSDCLKARQWADSGRVLAEKRADLAERSAKRSRWKWLVTGAGLVVAVRSILTVAR